MVFNKEMQEIVTFLAKQKKYAIFAGFAAYLHTGIEPSADIDVFMSQKDVVRTAKTFVKKGWTEIKRRLSQEVIVITVVKNNTTFDIITVPQKSPYFKTRVTCAFRGKKLQVISSEALLITKMNQLTWESRTDVKTKRDRKVIALLRKKINVKKMRALLPHLSDHFWTKGYF